jgi:hypothetical protein
MDKDPKIVRPTKAEALNELKRNQGMLGMQITNFQMKFPSGSNRDHKRGGPAGFRPKRRMPV